MVLDVGGALGRVEVEELFHHRGSEDEVGVVRGQGVQGGRCLLINGKSVNQAFFCSSVF